MAFDKIIIAVDGSEFALYAAKKGIELARQLNAQTALVYVVDDAVTTANLDAGITPEAGLLLMTAEAENIFKIIENQYSEGQELMKFIPNGEPRKEILRLAKTFEADLLVIGTHGYTGLQHLLNSSTAEWIVRHSPIPVMVVKLADQ